MQYNISPETLIGCPFKEKDITVDKMLDGEVDDSIMQSLKDRNVTLTPNGALFKKNKRGFLPELMQSIYDDRVKYKQLLLEAKQEYENTKDPKLDKDISRYNNIQMAKKISLNSVYGAIGNSWFRYYDLLVAEAITTSGQLSIRWIERSLNRYLNQILKTDDMDYVIASDTDSVYITFDRLIDKLYPKGQDSREIVDFLDRLAREKIEPYIDQSYQDLATYVNAFEQKMFMKREVIADKGIWTAKKRYILNAWDVEGVRYQEPQLKIMGIEAVKSSTPAPCREKIKQALKIIMSSDEKELNDFIQEFRTEFMEMKPELIAYPRSVNGLTKWTESHNLFKKGAPIHCKGAILYNHLLKKNNLGNKFPSIQEGDKIKFLHLKEPNLYQSTSISFPAQLPKEFDFDSILDYDVQFEKSFVEPLKVIADKIKWNLDMSYGSQLTLEGFFN
jgi:DNA polymerase elongation subunit (family B)